MEERQILFFLFFFNSSKREKQILNPRRVLQFYFIICIAINSQLRLLLLTLLPGYLSACVCSHVQISMRRVNGVVKWSQNITVINCHYGADWIIRGASTGGQNKCWIARERERMDHTAVYSVGFGGIGVNSSVGGEFKKSSR